MPPEVDTPYRPTGLQASEEQLAIQMARQRHTIVEANAGAAKTTTLALRVAQALARGADPRAILVLTYTHEAVQAMRQACERIGLPAAVRHALRVQTFDDFSAEVLKPLEGASVSLHTRPEPLKPVVLAAIERVLDNPDERHRDAFAIEGTGEAAVEGMLAAFARLKGTLQLAREGAERTPDPTLAEDLGIDYLTLRCYWAYEHQRRGGHPDHPVFRAPGDATYDLARRLLDPDDFDDDHHPLQAGLHLVLVDEMHDTNRAMFTVLQHLLRVHPRAAFVGVGDRDQVIHAVAGADARFMGEAFDQEIGPARRMPLTASYRFGPHLAALAGRLAGKAYAASGTRQTIVQALPFEDDALAHGRVVQAITQREGLTPRQHASDMAVLLRHPHQSVALENLLLDQGVDYRCHGFDTYLHRPEVRFVRGLIAHAQQAFGEIELPATRIALLQAMLMFCGTQVETEADTPEARARDEADALRAVANQPELAPWFVENQVLRRADPLVRQHVAEALAVLAQGHTDALLARFTQALAPQALAARVMVRAEDIEQVAANIAGLVDSARGYDNVASFFRGMNARELRHHGMRARHCVVLSSIEAAKGLEFEHVIMPGLHQGEFSGSHLDTDERNLFYVGLTRARARLTLLYDPRRPSRFLRQAGLL
jgi:DNA helicase-2/ATP-dependent DNA helicase PcrA